MLYKRLKWLEKICFSDSGRHHWSEKSIEGGGSIPKVLKNSHWSWKKSDNFWSKYPSRTMSTIYFYNMRNAINRKKGIWITGSEKSKLQIRSRSETVWPGDEIGDKWNTQGPLDSWITAFNKIDRGCTLHLCMMWKIMHI